jgi:hypothetical protein
LSRETSVAISAQPDLALPPDLEDARAIVDVLRLVVRRPEESSCCTFGRSCVPRIFVEFPR